MSVTRSPQRGNSRKGPGAARGAYPPHPMPISRPVLLLAAVLVLPACVKTPPPGAEADASSTASATPAAASSAPATAAAAASSATPPVPAGLGAVGTSLAGRLAQEAQSRPPIHPNADEILAAFAKAGGMVPTKNQGLGSTYNAKFCEGGTTEDGLVTISICEYADADSAKAGLKALQDIFPAKAATHVLRKNTVLTTLKLKDGPPAQALEAKLLAAYKGL
jgi:hypothetical protein